MDEIQCGHFWNSAPDEFNSNSLKVIFDNNWSLSIAKNDYTKYMKQMYVAHTESLREIIGNLQLESYLTAFKPKHLFTLCKFRCANHRPPDVTGRCFNINSTNRKCNLCPINDVEDEFHYLFRCSHFETKRKDFLDSKYYYGTNTLKMKQLFNRANGTELTKLAKIAKVII